VQFHLLYHRQLTLEYIQVICISHLPQVASMSDHHLLISKSSKDDRTTNSAISRIFSAIFCAACPDTPESTSSNKIAV
jgi:hypothetical protein